MHVIVHLIQLHPDTDPAAFESWVRTVDYVTCPELPSVRAFSVQRAVHTEGEPWQYFEIIHVSGHSEFEADMRTPTFASLVSAFDTMASVVQEFAGVRLDPGYLAA
ncbi:RedY protein [Nocardia suismassiliense]|uniref:RedY protein n=1 Tax=Nocardia suismassiliense TaxID=2077092 RepID=UPI000D1D8EBA|nr:RedY protein [Nocardia suismassiliense]